MPFIHIKSLPFKKPLKLHAVLEGVTKDFSKGTGIELEHVTATWEFFPPDQYAVAGSSARRQPSHSHPVLVDLLAPDFNSPTRVKKMLKIVAASISTRTNVPMANIFINARRAHAGMVFDKGQIVVW